MVFPNFVMFVYMSRRKVICELIACVSHYEHIRMFCKMITIVINQSCINIGSVLDVVECYVTRNSPN